MSVSDFLYKRMETALEKAVKEGKTLTPSTNEPIVCDKNANVTFAVWGDPQISLISPFRSIRVFSAIEDIKNGDKLDALVLCGDITEYGAKCEYKMVKKLLDGANGKFNHIFAVPGNHDVRLRGYKKQVKRFTEFVNSLTCGEKDENDSYYYTRDINGVRFIMMGTDFSTFEAAYISENQLKKLQNDIATAPNNTPIFVFNHQTLKHTNGLPKTFQTKGKWRGSVGLQSNKLKEILSKYPNVYFVTGHLHYCTSEYTFEDYGNFKALAVPTIGVINHGGFNNMTQGYIISVYDDKVVLRSRVFGEGRYTPKEVPNAYIEVPIK